MINHSSKDICVTHTDDYEQDKVTAAIKRHFELLGVKERLKPDMKVLLKPNLLMKRRPEEATTTHPSVVLGVIECLMECGITAITIADSPGGPYTRAALSGIYNTCGMKSVVGKSGVSLNLGCDTFERKFENGVVVKSFTLIKPVEEADFIIDIAKLKSHAMTTLSGGVKNLFGTVPGLMKPEFHWRFPDKRNFCEMLVDLCETVSPDLTIIDTIVSMEGDGPSGGTPKSTGMLISGYNPYNIDVTLCQVTGIPDESVFTIVASQQRGFAVKSFSELSVIGDELLIYPDFKKPKVKSHCFTDRLPASLKFMKPAADKLLTARPVIIKKKCIGCGKCAESCPAHTISFVEKKAVINYSACIKCFCCHEMCPVKAIAIKRTKVFDL